MRVRTGCLLKCAVGTLLIGAALVANEAQAQSAGNAPPAPDLWWFHGYLEAGGRMFLNDPQRNGSNSDRQHSLAKYYEYSTIKPGAFLDGHVATGSNDGRYQADIWAKNVGYSDQRYLADLSKAGEHYLTLGWDQVPHVYSTSAKTLYNGVGGNALTLPGGLSNRLFDAAGCSPGPCGNPIDPANAAKVQAIINANVHQTDIGIRRDTASAEYRWTPTDAWDLKADFSNMRRTGTQVDSLAFSASTSGVRVDVPAPVADTTRNFGLNGEYAGTSFWNKKFNFKLAYGGSTFENDFNSYTVENPFCPTGAVANGCARTAAPSSPIARMTMDPDNQAHTFSGTLGADLPFKSRYMGTLSYTMMRQNQAFLPFTITAGLDPINGAPSNSTASLPASSLNGAINTLLSNNVLTTQITPELKSKLSYRYYDYDNQTAERLFKDWIITDTESAKAADFAPVRSLAISYTKQNAGAELNWHPTRQWNVGVAYGWERYDRSRQDVDVTNENSGKVYADWKPTNWITARGSWLYSERRYGTYDYLNFVGNFQWPVGGGVLYSPAYRQFFLNNRDRNKSQLSVSVDVIPNFTVTPTLGWRNDDYRLNDSLEVGLKSDRSWNAGLELAIAATPDTRFLFSYMKERHSQIVSSDGNGIPPFSDNYYTANVEDSVDTFVAAVDHAFIPNKLDLRLGYTVSLGVNNQPLIFAQDTGQLLSTGGQFPDVKTTFQRFEALAKYRFDDDQVRLLGWKGEVTAKLRYAWERTSVKNWQIDDMRAYMYSPALLNVGYMTQLAQDNPNYNVQLIAASLAWKW